MFPKTDKLVMRIIPNFKNATNRLLNFKNARIPLFPSETFQLVNPIRGATDVQIETEEARHHNKEDRTNDGQNNQRTAEVATCNGLGLPKKARKSEPSPQQTPRTGALSSHVAPVLSLLMILEQEPQ